MFLALRELKHAKLRYILIGLIMVLIAWLVLFVTGLANGLANDNGAAISSNKATYYVLQKDSDNRLTRSNLTASETDSVAKQVKNQKAPTWACKWARSHHPTKIKKQTLLISV